MEQKQPFIHPYVLGMQLIVANNQPIRRLATINSEMIQAYNNLMTKVYTRLRLDIEAQVNGGRKDNIYDHEIAINSLTQELSQLTYSIQEKAKDVASSISNNQLCADNGKKALNHLNDEILKLEKELNNITYTYTIPVPVSMKLVPLSTMKSTKQPNAPFVNLNVLNVDSVPAVTIRDIFVNIIEKMHKTTGDFGLVQDNKYGTIEQISRIFLGKNRSRSTGWIESVVYECSQILYNDSWKMTNGMTLIFAHIFNLLCNYYKNGGQMVLPILWNPISSSQIKKHILYQIIFLSQYGPLLRDQLPNIV